MSPVVLMQIYVLLSRWAFKYFGRGLLISKSKIHKAEGLSNIQCLQINSDGIENQFSLQVLIYSASRVTSSFCCSFYVVQCCQNL